jgi:chlorobactene lauroyltransferase
MLKAKKSVWFESVFAVYNRNLIKRRFGSLKVSNLEILQNSERSFPLIIYANHSSWWDGLTAFEISRAAKLDSFVMMEEKHLRRLFLFRKLGAFSVDRENARSARNSIEYSAGLLKENPRRTLWIFPQGEILPNDARPFVFFSGLSRIIKKVRSCYALPLAMRYEFAGEYKPEIFVKIGNADFIEQTENFNIKRQTEDFSKKLTTISDELKSDILSQNLKVYRKII